MLSPLRAGALLAILAARPALSLVIIPHAKLTKETLAAFDRYVRAREAVIERQITAGPFLWTAEKPERSRRLRQTGFLVESLSGNGPLVAEDGLIHDWLGAVFLPGATLDRVLTLVQDYDQHKNIYAPEVIGSKLVRRAGDFFQAHLRLRKHKFITIVLNTEYDVTYRRLSRTRAESRSYSTRISEVLGAGTAAEHELPQGDDHGFLWRLHSFWKFEERDGGVYMEVDAISLTRDVPRIVAPIVNPVVRQLPRESLEKTLLATRRALSSASPR